MITGKHTKILKEIQDYCIEMTKNGKCKKCFFHNKKSNEPYNCVLYDPEDWRLEDLKPNIISKDEYTILNNFDSNYKNYYISRHFLGDIYISKEKPFKEGTEVLFEGGEFLKISMFNHLFKTIRYGDEEFRRILDYIKEYEQWEEKKNENKKD